MLDWFKERNADVKLAFDELCPKNDKMTSGEIQKNILASHFANVVTKAIKEDMGGCLFSILIDDSPNMPVKEQMVVIDRYVLKYVIVFFYFCFVIHVFGFFRMMCVYSM